jgi:hypothetical protein
MENHQSNKKIKPISLSYEDNEIKIQEQPNLNTIFGNIRTSSIVPTGLPRKLVDQFIIYRSGTTYKLYVADLTNGTWFSVALS